MHQDARNLASVMHALASKLVMEHQTIQYIALEANANYTVRIVLDYKGTLRPIFWFAVSKDGSVYLMPRQTRPTLVSRKLKMAKGKFHFTYLDPVGDQITEKSVLKQAKLSFHPSGVINTPAARLERDSSRSMKEQQLICILLFRHPNEYRVIASPEQRKRDVYIRYPIEDSKPVMGQLYLAPLGAERLVQVESFAYQVNLFFRYMGLKGIRDLFLQLVLGHGDAAQWPPLSWVLFPTK
jgi:hypothetical protein